MSGTASVQILTGLARLGAVLRACGWRSADAHGLTPTQAQVLVFLEARGPLRVGDAALMLSVSQPTASDAIAALVRKGLVCRTNDPADGRAALMALTEAGRGEARVLSVWPDALLAAADTLSPEEQAALLRAMIKMIRELQVQGRIPVQRLCVTCRWFRPHVHANPAAPHHCEFVNAAFGDAALRLDCGEHEPASEPQAGAAWRRFAGAASPG